LCPRTQTHQVGAAPRGAYPLPPRIALPPGPRDFGASALRRSWVIPNDRRRPSPPIRPAAGGRRRRPLCSLIHLGSSHLFLSRYRRAPLVLWSRCFLEERPGRAAGPNSRSRCSTADSFAVSRFLNNSLTSRCEFQSSSIEIPAMSSFTKVAPRGMKTRVSFDLSEGAVCLVTQDTCFFSILHRIRLCRIRLPKVSAIPFSGIHPRRLASRDHATSAPAVHYLDCQWAAQACRVARA
jgi:hypothetical protein